MSINVDNLSVIANSISTLLFFPLWTILLIILNRIIPLINSKHFTLNLSIIVSCINIIFSIICLMLCINNSTTTFENNILWLDSDIQIFLGTLVDNVSSIFLLFSSIVLLFIQLFVYKFIKDDKNYHRFYIYLNFLNFSIFGLILSSNLIQAFVFLLLTNTSCYLLSTTKDTNIPSSIQKNYLINNFGDGCLLISILTLFYQTITFNPPQNLIPLSFSTLLFDIDNLYSMLSDTEFLLIGSLILINIAIKLGQVPFISSELKEKETNAQLTTNTISSIFLGICAMYILARLYPILILSDTALQIMIIIGVISALLGSYFILSQNNLKKILNCISIIQSGLILVCFGIKAYSVAFFHFLLFSLTLLLLAFSSKILISQNENINIKELSGIRKNNTLLTSFFIIGILSISGLLFSGFYSHHFMFSAIYDYGNIWLNFAYLLIIFLTTFGLARVYFLIFEGEKTLEIKNINKATLFITMFLAIIITILGYYIQKDFNKIIFFIHPEKLHVLDIIPFVIQLFVIANAMYIAFLLYVGQNKLFIKIKETTLNKNNLIYKLSYNCLYLDVLCKKINILFSKFISFFLFLKDFFIKELIIMFSFIIRFCNYFISKIQKNNLLMLFIIILIMIIIFIFYILNILMEV